ncbi:ComF family protein [Flavihumibacter fluvii]|uniref:ComF family protein n=1 Tax=Flavihumibacter fluvii TaxID=2838157 RepID=UPI001EFBE399|nr:ComF family protein [Flavihumibacter fluvii]ULQ51260.1 ComF family protein [Flavihumibacter fluvii]
MPAFLTLFHHLSGLFFPHTCAACGSANLVPDAGICPQCLATLPVTGYLHEPGNPVEEIFWGRITLQHAAACCFFAKKSRIQHALHQVKYHFRGDAAIHLGEWMGHQLSASAWFSSIDLLLPMPLHPKRQSERGYNQAELLCRGISAVTKLQQLPNALVRKSATRSQTHQHRHERWENMQGVFGIADPGPLANRHILLIDDVVTTGATLEAMGEQLLKIPGLTLSICCFAYTVKH